MVVFAEWLLRTGWQAAVLAGMVLLAQWLFGRWLSPAWRYRLWGLVVLRLMLPALPASPWSLFNLDPVSAAGLASDTSLQQHGGREEYMTARSLPAAESAEGGVITARGAAGLQVTVRTTPPPVLTGTPVRRPVAPANPPTRVDSGSLLLFLFVWAAGAAVLALRLAWGHVTFARRLRRATPLDDTAAHALLGRCAREAGLRRSPRVLVTDAVHGPAVCGLLRPTLLLPPGLTWRLEPDELRMVFLHELAHLRCRDVAANWLLEALQVMHWFNPVLWLAFARCRADREMARDAMVLARVARESHPDSGIAPVPGAAQEPAERYGQVLLKLLQQAAFAPPRVSQAVGMAGVLDSLSPLDLLPRRGRLTQRIHMIATFTRNARAASRFPLVALLLMLGIGCTALTSAKDPAAGGKPPPSGEKQPRAGKGPAAEADEDAVVTRMYDVHDLLVVVPDFDDVPQLGISRPVPRAAGTQPALPESTTRPSSAPGRATREQHTREQYARDLIQLVTETVAPDSWRDTGGATGAVRVRQGQLVVTQSVRNHREVLRLLEKLRETKGVQISLEATFLAVDPEAWKKLETEWGLVAGQREAPLLYLSEEQAKRLLALDGAGAAPKVVSSPRMMLFNGQRAYILISTQQAYVSNLTPVTNEHGAVAYEPEISTVESGLVLDAQATVSADRKYVTLTLHPRVSALLGFKERRLPPPAPGAEGAVVQEPQVRLSEVRTTVSVPDGGTLLLGGMEDPDGALLDGRRERAPAGAGGAATRPAATRPAGAKQPRALLLMVKPTVILQREGRK